MSNIEEYKTKNFIKAYEEAKAQSFIIESINKDFFFEFADCLIARIKELEEENRIYALNGNNVKLELYIKENYIPKQKVKGLLTEIQKEYEKLDKASDEFLSNEKKTVEDYILEKERLATMQTLAYCRDNLEEWLKEDKQ